MRYLFVTPDGVIDTLTGEVSDRISIEQLLTEEPGGIIAGRNLYPILAPLANNIKRDSGWTMVVNTQKKRQPQKLVGGMIYVSHLYYRKPKPIKYQEYEVKTNYGKMIRKRRIYYRPNSIKWTVLNLELFCESEDIENAARALVVLAEARGILPKYSPGSYGAGLLRASPEWEKGRHAAPGFISDIAREHLPGNYYELKYRSKRADHAYYLDQKSSHHTIAATTPLPHPQLLRARGRLRSVEKDKYPPWILADKLSMLDKHSGLLCCMVECDTIPPSLIHLYPQWARKRGRHHVWIYTPDLRIFDRRIRLLWVSAALTSYHPDPVLEEYAKWSLEFLEGENHPAVKPALLAAYGMLAVRTDGSIERYSVHGRSKPPRSEVCKLPLIDTVYRSNIKRIRTPSLQNVVARGVIESETRTRSIEYARRLENEGHPVVQIYADGLITTAKQLPFLPDGWRVASALTGVTFRHPNTIISREIVRLPGIPGGRRTSSLLSAYLNPSAERDAKILARRS